MTPMDELDSPWGLHPEDTVIRSEAERYLFAEAQVGIAVEDFLRTDAGRYLKGRAEQDIGAAIATFLDNDLRRNEDVVARAQQKAREARRAFHWMLEAIIEGKQAEHNLAELDTADGHH